MGETLTADDVAYRERFDVKEDVERWGKATFEGDLQARMDALRDQAPVHKGSLRTLVGVRPHEGRTVQRPDYTFLSFEVCDRAFRDGETFSMATNWETAMLAALGDTIFHRDGAPHRCLRAVAQPMFVPPAMTWWNENWVQGIIDELIDNLKGRTRADLNMDVCARLPLRVVTECMGMSPEAALDFRDKLLVATGSYVSTEEEKTVAMAWVVERILEMIAERRKRPSEDVISRLVETQMETDDGKMRGLNDEEITSYVRFLVLAGGTTTWRQMGLTLNAMLTHGAWEECMANRELIPQTVLESFRWQPTDAVFSRMTTREVEIGGLVVPAGARIGVCTGAANRDPARWDNPTVFDIHRPYKTNLALGVGAHQCLGQNVAKLEFHSIINRLMDEFPNMRPDPDEPAPDIVGGVEFRGVSALPVLLQ